MTQVVKHTKPVTFADYSDAGELKKHVVLAVKKICSDLAIGFEKIPDSRLVTIISMLSKYYRDLSVKDLLEAFELMIVGELDHWLPKDKRGAAEKAHYNELSVEYFMKIVTAYRKRKVARTPAERLLEAAKEPSEEQKIILHGNYLHDLVVWADHNKMQSAFPLLGTEWNYSLFLKWGLVPEDGNTVLKIKKQKERPQFQNKKGREDSVLSDGFSHQRKQYIMDAVRKLHKKGKTLKSIILKFEYNEKQKPKT